MDLLPLSTADMYCSAMDCTLADSVYCPLKPDESRKRIAQGGTCAGKQHRQWYECPILVFGGHLFHLIGRDPLPIEACSNTFLEVRLLPIWICCLGNGQTGLGFLVTNLVLRLDQRAFDLATRSRISVM